MHNFICVIFHVYIKFLYREIINKAQFVLNNSYLNTKTHLENQ